MKLEDARAIVDFVVREASSPVSERESSTGSSLFLGGLAAFEGETRVGAVGVSGLTGEVDEALAGQALEAAGLSC